MDGELVYMKLFDVGRHIDISAVVGELSGSQPMTTTVTKDTTPNISLPRPIIVELESHQHSESPYFRSATLSAKIYEDGVITFISRLAFENVPLDQLHVLKTTEFYTDVKNEKLEIFGWIDRRFLEMMKRIDQFIDKEYYELFTPEFETYAAYCITSDEGDPGEFIHAHENYIASFLQGDSPSVRYHPSQIKATLDNPFSYLENDLVIFDLDRCIIIDPNKDYEDILLVAEIANYQVLELSTLDQVLDHELDMAEDELRMVFSKARKPYRLLGKKVAELRKLRVDMTFLLEDIENSSKLIGDYYLAQIYRHLGNLFSLKEWSTSIRNRLDALDSVYNTTRTDLSTTVLLWIEIFFLFLFGFEFIFGFFHF
ncbi:MAG TPA: hypothetical protein VKM55_08760 [Candidatus Lokiarchaeia archaeon]|nr:hypothetical protein [Candidatus Lokiarchaeia archaeon]